MVKIWKYILFLLLLTSGVIWIAVYLYSRKKFTQALKYFETVQYYYQQHPERAEKADSQFLDIAASVCHAELGDYQKAAKYLAKVAPHFDNK